MAGASSSSSAEPKKQTSKHMASSSSSAEPKKRTSKHIASSSSSAKKITKLTIIGPSRPTDKAYGKQPLTYDFSFELQPSARFRHAIGALANYRFNPTREAVMEVDSSGLSITVYNVTQSEPGCTEESVFGFYRLLAEHFNFFECVNSVTKRVDLERIMVSLSTGRDDYLLTVSSIHHSNELTIEFKPLRKRDPAVIPSVVDLLQVRTEYRGFPDVSYGNVIPIPSLVLTSLIEPNLRATPADQSDFVQVDIQKAIVRVQISHLSFETPGKLDEVWLAWPFWETLGRAATFMARTCLLHVDLEPPGNLNFMLLFKLNETHDRIFFQRGDLVPNRISCLAFFGQRI